MPQAPLSAHKIRKLLLSSVAADFNKTKTATQLRIARSSATKYINAFRRSALTSSEIERARAHQLHQLIFPIRRPHIHSNAKCFLLERFAAINSRIENDGLSILDTWREEIASNSCTYKYSHFASLDASWRTEHGFPQRSRTRKIFLSVKPADLRLLKGWKRSHDKRKWEVAVVLLGLLSGRGISELCHMIARERRTVQNWCKIYESAGINGLPLNRSRYISEKMQEAIDEKKRKLVKIIHEAPNAYGINRSTWSLQSLSDAYRKTHGGCVSKSSISEYFHTAGYKFKKAKKSLTSYDPYFRDKLTKIRNTLSQLAVNEKFFSIDEFGPFSVKLRGGMALVPRDEIRTVPQRQRAKDSLICPRIII